MSDSSSPPPVKPKPGSLRDRIAAFEKPAAAGSSAPKPPPVRPKPTHTTWKPAPPPLPENVGDEEKKLIANGMSASDAKESIRAGGGSLRERMAALQGKGAFGSQSASPQPAPPKPTKRPPLVVSPPAEEPDEITKGPPPEKPPAEEEGAEEEHPEDEDSLEAKEEAAEENDEEAKERERRATIAARMAKLGGARVGMAPPLFAPKPAVRPQPAVAKSEKVEAPEASISPPEVKSPPVPEETPPPEVMSDTLSKEVALEDISIPVEKEVLTVIPTPIEVKETGSDTLQDVTSSDFKSRAAPLLPPASDSSPTSSPEESTPPKPSVDTTLSPNPSPAVSPSPNSKSPTPSIPIPSVPRRAAPPRKKKSEPKKQESAETPASEAEVPVESAQLKEESDVKAAFSDEQTSSLEQADKKLEPVSAAPGGLSTPKKKMQQVSEDAESDTALVDKVDSVVSRPKHEDENVPSPPEPEHVSAASAPAPEVAHNEEPGHESVSEELTPVKTPKHHDGASQVDKELVGPASSLDSPIREAVPEHEETGSAQPFEAEEMKESEHFELQQDEDEERSLAAQTPVAEVSQAKESDGEKGHSPVHKDEQEVEPVSPVENIPVADAHSEDEELPVVPQADDTPAEPKQESKLQEEEPEDDKAARKKRIAERLGKMGGLNPFTAAPAFARPPAVPQRQVSREHQEEDNEEDDFEQEIKAVTKDDHQLANDEPVTDAHTSTSISSEDEVKEESPPVHDEEDDEAARKRRIAEKLAKMGGRNPFAAAPTFHPPPPPRRHTSDDEYRPNLVEESAAEPSKPDSDHKEAFDATDLDAPALIQIHEEEEPHARGASEVEPEEETLEVEETALAETFERSPSPSAPSATERRPGHLEGLESNQQEQENVQPGEESDEMAPVRITRPIPPLPPSEAKVEARIQSPIEHVTSPKRSLPPPPAEVASEDPESDSEQEEQEEQEEVEEGSEEEETTPTNAHHETPPPPPPRVPHAPRLISPPARSVPTIPQEEDGVGSPASTKSHSSFSPPRRFIPPPPPTENTEDQQQSSVATPVRTISQPGRPPIPNMRPTSPPARPTSPPRPSFSPPPPPPNRPQLDHIRVRSPIREVPPAPEAPKVVERAVGDVAPPRQTVEEQEVLPDSEPDPVDPSLPSPRSPAAFKVPPPFIQSTNQPSEEALAEDDEQSRRRTIAERMAKLGGIKFGAPPPVRRPAPPPRATSQDEGLTEETEETEEPKEEEAQPEESQTGESERARRQAIAARLAGMGGMRFGMLPQMTPPASGHPRMPSTESTKTVEARSPPPERAVPLPPAQQSEPEDASDDGVKVEPEESEMSMEEITAEDAEEESEEVPPPPPARERRPISPPTTAPPPPSRTGRPPVPTASIPSPPPRSDSQRPDFNRAPTSNDFVMVDSQEEAPPPPPPSRSKPSHTRSSGSGAPAPPSKQASGGAWELPEIPSGSLDLSGGFKMNSSATSEDSTAYPAPLSSSPPVMAPPPPPAREASTPTPARPVAPPTQEELVNLAKTLGKQVQSAASSLYDKSKKNIIGDGTSQGFVDAVLAQVPQASRASQAHLIYSQTANTVTKRLTNISPGDIVELTEAKLKGHKGLQSYHQSAGTAQQPLVAIVGEFDTKKTKVKVFQANQHVGSQSVEMVSYRLDDLKSGTVRIFRVAHA